MLNVQPIKDSFYAALRDRIAAGNPARTIVVRGIIRPAVLVVENEFPTAAVDGIAPAETFCIRWSTLTLDAQTALPLCTLGCEIRYASDGSSGAGGLDRGRTLAAMDTELATALTTSPMNTSTTVTAESPGGGGANATATGTLLFWSNPVLTPTVTRGARLERSVQIEVYGHAQ